MSTVLWQGYRLLQQPFQWVATGNTVYGWEKDGKLVPCQVAQKRTSDFFPMHIWNYTNRNCLSTRPAPSPAVWGWVSRKPKTDCMQVHLLTESLSFISHGHLLPRCPKGKLSPCPNRKHFKGFTDMWHFVSILWLPYVFLNGRLWS